MNVNVGQSEVIANETIDIPQKIKINESNRKCKRKSEPSH